MDLRESFAVYVDDRVEEERWISKDDIIPSGETSDGSKLLPLLDGAVEVQQNIELLARAFKNLYICTSGKSFAGKLAELSDDAYSCALPVFGFVDVDFTGDSESLRRRSAVQTTPQTSLAATLEPSPPRRALTFSSQSEDLFGLHLLSRFSGDIQAQEEPSVIVPIAVLRNDEAGSADGNTGLAESTETQGAQRLRAVGSKTERQQQMIHRCLDAGAVDVLTSPLDEPTLHRLAVHAYRTQRTAQKEQARFLTSRKLRKKSWVGEPDEKPYAYLREVMVSKLMKRICNPEEVVEDFSTCELSITEERKHEIETEVAKWQFCAIDFTDDELVYAASSMILHALQLPELEAWRISSDEVTAFILSCRAAYNSFVIYHNFRHAVDVLQSTFHFLVRIGVLPEYPGSGPISSQRSEVASILTPFDALTLLISAIGHDVGHPGVNNLFLVKLNAPLAQLYNDKSVLEAFHCAAFSQILRHHWPAAFQDTKMRALMISSILATDMGVHNHYIECMTKTREEYHSHRGGGQCWEPRDPDGCRALLCALIIKCADIGNVSRHWETAMKWTDILQLEFANQGEMERDIGMETALFGGPPNLEDFVKKANGQIGFMNVFALPLFDGVTELLPDMAFAANQIRCNQAMWKRLIDREKAKELPVELRPTEEDLVRKAKAEGYYTMDSSKPPSESWKEPPVIPQYDGSKEECADSVVSGQEKRQDEQNGVISHTRSTSGGTTASVTGDSRSNSKRGSGDSSPGGGGDGTPPSPDCNGHHGDARRGMGHLQFQRSSGRSSVTTPVNSNSRQNDTRTQSTSTYTNNTVMTPISSVTQASSVISGESSCDGEHCSAVGKEEDRPAFIHPRYDPTSVNHKNDHIRHVIAPPDDLAPVPQYRSRGDPNGQSMERTTNFMTSILDQSFGDDQSNGLTLKDPSSTSNDTVVPPNSPPTSPPSSSPSMDASNRGLPRRRSRLRLAFWRRNKQTSASPPPNAHPNSY